MTIKENNISTKLLFKKIKENNKKLNDCKLHKFHDFNKDIHINTRLTCLNCKGSMLFSDIMNYLEGYKASGKDIKDIITNYV